MMRFLPFTIPLITMPMRATPWNSMWSAPTWIRARRNITNMKAAMTMDNKEWDSLKLHGELLAEKAAIEAAAKEETKE